MFRQLYSTMRESGVPVLPLAEGLLCRPISPYSGRDCKVTQVILHGVVAPDSPGLKDGDTPSDLALLPRAGPETV